MAIDGTTVKRKAVRMPGNLVGMVDAGFLKEAGSRAIKARLGDLNINPHEIVEWLARSALRLDVRYLRGYWYDAAYQPGTQTATEQRKFFDELEETPGMQVRLGSLMERPRPWEPRVRRVAKELGVDPKDFISRMDLGKQYEQKGVDTLIVMDLMRFAQQRTCDYIILLAGDRDLAEPVRSAQELGCSVLIAAPIGTKLSPEISRLSDETLWLTQPMLKRFLLPAGDDGSS